MDIHEFELRYLAYTWLNNYFKLNRPDEQIINLVQISSLWIPSKKIQELSTEELHEITIQTYTDFKKQFISEAQIQYPDLEWFSLQNYIERLEYELKVIKEMWFNSYFLIVADFIQRAKTNNIVVWPWRWSWAGSLLARLTKITDINPLPFGLLFERFLNPARVSMPDFDIDFEDELREKVIEYVTQKYWKDKVCAIWTYMKLATKAAFKDAARALWVSFEASNVFSALIPNEWIQFALQSKEWNEKLQLMYEQDEKIKEAVHFSEKLEWNLRQLWVHACWIIIAPQNVHNYSPIQYIKDDSTLWTVSQYDWPTMETIGLLKMDFLWLRNLSVIKNCIKIITKKHEKENIPLPEIFKNFRENSSFKPPLDDNHTYEKVFQTGKTTWIFQFESQWMRRFLVQLEANSINDLVAMNALYRPWPMEFIPKYIDRKHGREKVSYMQTELAEILKHKYWEETIEEESKKLREDLNPIMDVTYWIAVYQEQLMFLVQAMAGFSLAEADLLRRWIGKKKKEVIEQLKKEFVIRWEQHRNYKPETTQFIYEKMIEPAASYSFNKSHSVCYSVIAYQTAYLKAYYPVEFYASLIRSVEEDTDEMSFYIYEAQIQWIWVLPPNINDSFNHVAAIRWEIRLWFLWVKGLWREIGESIQEERKKNWKFSSLEDFLKRCHKIINKKSIESLTKSGALDDFADRNTILNNTLQVIERSKSSQTMSMGLFGWDSMTTKLSFANNFTTSTIEKLMMEQSVFKSFVSWHPLDWLYPYLKKFSFISQIKDENAWSFIITGYIKDIQRAKKKWFFTKIEDISGQFEIFFKNVLDFKKMDIIIIKWFKWKWTMIEKIIKTDIDKLKKLAWSKFDPEMTVIKARKLRSSEDIKKEYEITEPINLKTQNQQDKNIEKTQIIEENDIESTAVSEFQSSEEPTETYEFPLPEDVQKIKKIWHIKLLYPWNIVVIIWPKKIMLNQVWVQKIKELI